MTMRLHGKSGEAVMLVLMGAMIVGGLVLWLSTGNFHMMPMKGESHSMKQESAEAHLAEQMEDQMSPMEEHDAAVEGHSGNKERGGRSGMDRP